MKATEIVLSKRAERDIKTVPAHITKKLLAWIDSIEHEGLIATRKIPGYHDEPLQGNRQGQRSIRLNKAYRAIYQVSASGNIEIVEILEINKHKY